VIFSNKTKVLQSCGNIDRRMFLHTCTRMEIRSSDSRCFPANFCRCPRIYQEIEIRYLRKTVVIFSNLTKVLQSCGNIDRRMFLHTCTRMEIRSSDSQCFPANFCRCPQSPNFLATVICNMKTLSEFSEQEIFLFLDYRLMVQAE
jgi:glutamyl-tRNA reductase